ncbi:biotin-dependent carboxyltransferase family protein [Pantoea cypripedii]|uniref:Aminopeptidase n=1 Tax=Pantoea cypripedii TaxID=55209 RepID=A0A6B9GH33_PANCY|nr:biotin-dependent carboxyltransferase family protein [Pantoea cypripedii]QGY32945.1 aminopeptidase [Pantoea cypripedii]
MLEIVKPGLETSVQELPGRIGYWEQGFPPSGPVDAWSFRLANLLVGNHRDMAALEWQFIGPTVRFLEDAVIALTGAEHVAQLDGVLVPCWQTVRVQKGQVLNCGAAKKGARGYIAIAGGINTQPVLGSRATFHMASIGGTGNGALKTGDCLPLGKVADDVAALSAPLEVRPVIDPALRVSGEDRAIPVMAGPNDHWLDANGIDVFTNSEWNVLPQSNRTGMRLKGPELTFSSAASDKPPEHGTHPSNILDHGYPLGGISIAGQTPIIFINDSPSAGGFMVPFTVPSAAIWRLGQLRPGEKIRFRLISREEADLLRKKIDALCHSGCLATLPSAN